MSKKKYITSCVVVILLIASLTTSSCKKFIEVDTPVTSTNADLVYANDASAISVLTGIYSRMSEGGINNGFTSLSLFAGLAADELSLYTGATDLDYLAFYQNALVSSGPRHFWPDIYMTIFAANSAIEGITLSSTLTPQVKEHLLGEAKFIRGFCYFYLVNLYGDVPLVLTADYKENSTIARTDKTKVYEQVIADLKEAKELLSGDYLDVTLLNPSSERTAPNKWAATALLARSYLYNGDYANAELEATAVIDNNSVYEIVPLNEVFLKNNKEAIWQLQPVSDYITNTSEARIFILPPDGPNAFEKKVYLSDVLKKSFEPGDIRKEVWIDSLTTDNATYSYAAKYKNNELFVDVTEYSMVLRLAEQYLVRAEARAQQGDVAGAQADLNVIRERAGIANTAADSKEALLTAILQERQVELFTEWGHRWLDVKRRGLADTIMTEVAPGKGASWESTDQLFPLPSGDLQTNPNLVQNQGY